MKVVFLGNPVPAAFLTKTVNTNYSVADNIAQNSLIAGLFEKYQDDFSVITAAANFESPAILNRRTRRTRLRLDCGITARAVGNLNYNKPLYYLSLLWTYTRELLRVFRESPDATDFLVITSGPYIFTALPVVVARLRRRICFVPFLIGAVELPDYTGIYHLASKLSRITIRAADATITYVERSSIAYTKKPYVAILYALDEDKIRLSSVYVGQAKSETFTVLYSGALTKIKGADLLMAAIDKAPDRYRWVICGAGEFEEDIRRLAQAHSNVEFLGLVGQEECIRLQAEANVLIALQSVEGDEYRYYSEYAATAKLIEYLLSGTPVISPDIGAVSSQIRPYLNFLTSQSPDDIIGLIDKISADYATYLSQAARGRDYVMEHANARYQNRLVIEFLERVCRDKLGQ